MSIAHLLLARGHDDVYMNVGRDQNHTSGVINIRHEPCYEFYSHLYCLLNGRDDWTVN